MSYCESRWISDYHFTNALLYRLNREAAAAAPVRPPAVESLLLRGGLGGSDWPVPEGPRAWMPGVSGPSRSRAMRRADVC